MGNNNKPGGNTPIFLIQARPKEHDAVVERQGQWARILHSQPCTCIKTDGHPSMNCTKCRGAGFVYYFQSEKEVIEENSPHCGQNVINPYWTPITKVIKVQRKLAPIQGGNKNYLIKSFNDDTIYIEGATPPKSSDIIQCTYRYSNLDEKIQSFIYNGINKFEMNLYIDTVKEDMEYLARSNAYKVAGDITQIISFINKGQEGNIKSSNYLSYITFKKQYIYLDTTDIIDLDTNDILEIKVQYSKPELVATTQLTTKRMYEKWGSNIETGDVDAIFQSNVDIKNGDIITFLISNQSKSWLMTRTRKDYDELPEYDVIEILENIIDEDNNKYIKDTDFEIRNYNDLYWIGNKPSDGKKYSIVFSYKLTYIVFNENIKTITNENQRFPKNVLLRLYTRVKNKEMELIS